MVLGRRQPDGTEPFGSNHRLHVVQERGTDAVALPVLVNPKSADFDTLRARLLDTPRADYLRFDRDNVQTTLVDPVTDVVPLIVSSLAGTPSSRCTRHPLR